MVVPQDREGFLIKEDMETPRTPQQLQKWVDWVLNKMNLPQYEEYCLLRIGLSQNFYEEIYPLNFFIQDLFCGREDVMCQPKIGSQPFDAILEISGRKQRYIEITFNHDGRQDNLDMQFFIPNRRVALGQTKRNDQRELENEITFNSGSEARERICNYIKDAFIAKSEKGYGPDYILIIVFDDHISFKNDKYIPTLLDFVDKELDCSATEFEAVYLVGMSGRNIISLKALDT